jgi:hypothetical protein
MRLGEPLKPAQASCSTDKPEPPKLRPRVVDVSRPAPRMTRAQASRKLAGFWRSR